VALSLNKAHSDRIRENLDFHRDLAEKCRELLRTTDPADVARVLHFKRSIAHELIQVGRMAYQPERPLGEVGEAFGQATTFLTDAFAIPKNTIPTRSATVGN